MKLLCVGLNHKTAPVEIREQVAFKKEDVPLALARFKERYPDHPAVLLSTCNRTEMYTLDLPTERVSQFLSEERLIAPDLLAKSLYHYTDKEAVRHLFQVAASLDSMVVGEAEILGQVKDAYALAVTSGTTDRILNAFFQRSLGVAKEIRSSTKIGAHKVSVSSVAVDLACQIFRSLQDKTVMVIGTGETGELTLRYLINQGIKHVLLCNRTYVKAQDLAKTYGGTAVPFDLLDDYLIQADIVISSTSANHYILTYPQIKQIVRKRRNALLFLIDIAVPRDIDPEVNKLDEVYLYDIDDLRQIVEKNMGHREQELVASTSLIEIEVEKFMGWLHTLSLGPLFQELDKTISEIQTKEMERFFRRVSSLSPQDQEEVKILLERLTNKILHLPKQHIRHQVSQGEHRYLDILRELFQLNGNHPGK